MTTWWCPDPIPDPRQGGGAELLDLTNGEGVGFEVTGVDAGVHLDLRVAGCLKLTGQDAEGLDLAHAERRGVAVEVELVGDGKELVVELLEHQGVAGGFQVGGAEEVRGVGVGEGDVPAGLGLVLAVFVVLGS